MTSLAALVMQAYPSPEWAVFLEVADRPGGGRRRADAVALGIWPSRGHTIVGFEFKTDRRDWLRERKNPAKADLVATHCDSWFLVTSSDQIATLDELPAPWGLLVANADRTRLLTRKPCQPFPDRDTTTLRRSFAASLLRRVSETTVPRSEMGRLVDEAAAAAVLRTREGRELEQLRTRVETLEAGYAAFKQATGVDLLGWQGTTKIAEAVGAVLHLGQDRYQLEHTQRLLTEAAHRIAKALAAWPGEGGPSRAARGA